MRSVQYLNLDINKKTQQVITANVGEIGSRYVKIKLIDNDKPLDLTGVSVFLYSVKSDYTKVFNTAEIEDAKNGIILAQITSQLMLTPGSIKLTLVLLSGDSKLGSKEFTLNVDDSILKDEVVESTNEFTALTTALTKVQGIDNKFANIDEQFNTIEQEKLNKNGIVTMVNMGQDVKEAMTGGSVAVVGENMILDVNIVDNQVRPNKTSFISEERNLFDKQIYVKGIVSSVDGHIISNDNFACSNFIRFEKGKTYNITSCYDYATYNKDKVFIRGVEHPKAPLTFKSDSDDEKYIMYTMDLADVETNMMCEGELPSEYIDGSYGKNGKISLSNELKEPIIELINSQKTHKFLNKIGNFLGDSITEHNGATTKNYHDFIKEWTGINVNNYGVSGTGYTETTSTPNNRFIQRVSSMDTNADIVTVFGGINDFYFGTKPIGQFGDKTSNTFYGAVDELILALINKFPTKTIAVFTPLISTLSLNPNTRGETLNQYVQAIIEVCNYYAIPVLDLNKCSGLNPNVEVIKTNYIPDGTHPNANGHEKIAYKILSFLESL